MTPNPFNQFLDWLSGKTESPAVNRHHTAATPLVPPVVAKPDPTPMVIPPPEPPVPSPQQELRSFRALVANHIDYAAARRQALATTDQLFQREERQWRLALAANRDRALQACGARISGEELNVVASNFASNALFATEAHRYFDGNGRFGSALLGALTSVVLKAELALGRQAFRHIGWPQPYWTSHNLPRLDNRPPPLKLVATSQLLSFVKTTHSVDELAETIHRIEQQLLGRVTAHRQALHSFVEQAVADRQRLLVHWSTQLAQDSTAAKETEVPAAQLVCQIA